MTTPSLRQLLADVLVEADLEWGRRPPASTDLADHFADALLASPEVADIIDLAAKWGVKDDHPLAPLLADWQANRAEQKPTP